MHRVHHDLDALKARIYVLMLKVRCNKHSAYTERPTPSPPPRGGPVSKHEHV
jgi:hypothetical protein